MPDILIKVLEHVCDTTEHDKAPPRGLRRGCSETLGDGDTCTCNRYINM
jgi:hypothetical protein